MYCQTRSSSAQASSATRQMHAAVPAVDLSTQPGESLGVHHAEVDPRSAPLLTKLPAQFHDRRGAADNCARHSRPCCCASTWRVPEETCGRGDDRRDSPGRRGGVRPDWIRCHGLDGRMHHLVFDRECACPGRSCAGGCGRSRGTPRSRWPARSASSSAAGSVVRFCIQDVSGIEVALGVATNLDEPFWRWRCGWRSRGAGQSRSCVSLRWRAGRRSSRLRASRRARK